jgi:transposase-like protein
VIDFGTTENLFFDPQAQKFSTMKPKLLQLIADGKDLPAISKELNVNIKKVESWIKLLDSENKSLEKPSEIATSKTVQKPAKVEIKNSDAAEKVS